MSAGKEKPQTLINRMRRLQIDEDDLVERFILGSGSGGQKINKTSSCVYLRHIPSGIEIKCQRERSREANRYLARQELCDRIENKILKERLEKKKLEAKIRQQNRRPSRKQKEKMFENKRLHSEKKVMRKPPRENDT